MPFTRWRVQLFGVLQVSSDKEIITRFRSKSTGALFAYLAYHNGRPQPREVLINEVWGEVPLEQGRARLSTALSSLRSQFTSSDSGSEVIFADRLNVTLNPELFETDVATFQDALKRAKRTAITPSERRHWLEIAVNCYQGELLVGQYSSWILPELEKLRLEFERATAELASLNDLSADSASGEVASIPSATRSSDVPSINASVLPPTYTRFFGRTEELDRLTTLLAPSAERPLITLTGIGGIGKTRLAHEAARRLEDTFPGRVWFVELAELREAERLMDTILESLRLPKDPSSDPLQQCADFLANAPSLLVLDNMEQFVAEGCAAILLQKLRDAVPSLVCLVTSRQVLGIRGERAVAVGSLTGAELDTCLLLFEDRARAVSPDFSVNESNHPTIQKLCLVLEGIPLAIELAAARINIFTPSQMLVQMEERFALLRSRKRDVPTRHQSIWAAIDSSYLMLPEELRAVFARLSIFRGGWTLAALGAICLEPNVGFTSLDAVTELREASLIFASSAESSPRFQMLDTIREYAAEQLRLQGGEEAARLKHAAYFNRLAIEAEPFLKTGVATEKVWLDRLGEDLENLRSAMGGGMSAVELLRTAVAIHRFWSIRGQAAEGRQLLHSALEAAASLSSEDVSASELIAAQNALGVLSLYAGAYPEARQSFELVLKHNEEIGNKVRIAGALNNIAIAATRMGDFVRARASYEESLRLYRELGDSALEGTVLTNLGGVLMLMQDYETAHKVLKDCLAIQRATHDDLNLHQTLHNLSEVALRQEDITLAVSTLLESLAIRRTLRDQAGFDEVLVTAAIILGKSNRIEEAYVVWMAIQSLRLLTGTAPPEATVQEETYWFHLTQKKIPGEIIDELKQKGRSMDFGQTISYIEALLWTISGQRESVAPPSPGLPASQTTASKNGVAPTSLD